MSDIDFQKRWREARRPGLSGRLTGMVRQVYDEFVRDDPDLRRLKTALSDLLTFLGSPGGFTDPNCAAVDSFFCLLSVERDELMDRLPDDFRGVIDEMGLNLGVAVRDPELAADCDATPEILLERARALKAETGPARSINTMSGADPGAKEEPS